MIFFSTYVGLVVVCIALSATCLALSEKNVSSSIIIPGGQYIPAIDPEPPFTPVVPDRTIITHPALPPKHTPKPIYTDPALPPMPPMPPVPPYYPNLPSVKNLVAVSSGVQILWASISIFFVYLVGTALIRAVDSSIKEIFKIVTGLLVIGLNIWVLTSSITLFSTYSSDKNMIMDKSLASVLLATGALGLVSALFFFAGVVSYFLPKVKPQYKPF